MVLQKQHKLLGGGQEARSLVPKLGRQLLNR